MDEVRDYGHGGTWLFFHVFQDKGYLLELFHFTASNGRGTYMKEAFVCT